MLRFNFQLKPLVYLEFCFRNQPAIFFKKKQAYSEGRQSLKEEGSMLFLETPGVWERG